MICEARFDNTFYYFGYEREVRDWTVVIEMNVEVASDDEFMGGGSSEREEGLEVLKENRVWFRCGDDEGGR